MSSETSTVANEPTDEDLFDDLYRLRDEGDGDRIYPVPGDVIREGRYSVSQYRKRWGSVARARIAAGMHPPPRETIRDHLRERATDEGHLYTDSKAVARAIGLETRTVGRILPDLENDDRDGEDEDGESDTAGGSGGDSDQNRSGDGDDGGGGGSDDGEDVGFKLSRRAGGTNGRVLWEVRES